MSDNQTPRSSILAFFGKRSHPSTGSSEGAISNPKKSSRIEEEVNNIRKDLSSELDESVEMATETVLKDFEERLVQCFEDFKQYMHKELKKVTDKMTDRMNEVETTVKKWETQMKEKEERHEKERKLWEQRLKEVERRHEESTRLMKIELNRQTQYSRKDNIRIFGLEEKQNENSKAVVCELISVKLGAKIAPPDISAAHRLPKTGKQRHRPMIVRLKDRSQRQEILTLRKRLKNSGVSIAEDMTRENVLLVKEAEISGLFRSVWFSNGKVHAMGKNGHKHILNLFDNFKELSKK